MGNFFFKSESSYSGKAGNYTGFGVRIWNKKAKIDVMGAARNSETASGNFGELKVNFPPIFQTGDKHKVKMGIESRTRQVFETGSETDKSTHYINQRLALKTNYDYGRFGAYNITGVNSKFIEDDLQTYTPMTLFGASCKVGEAKTTELYTEVELSRTHNLNNNSKQNSVTGYLGIKVNF
jgi:hypothetical protein